MRKLTLLLPMAILLMTGSALATEPSDREATRALVRRGVERFEARDYVEARDDFDAALKHAEVPAIAFWAGKAHEKLGELVEAAALFAAATKMQQNELWADKATQLNAKKGAAQALRLLQPRIPSLQLEFKSCLASEMEVTLDGVTLTYTAGLAPLSVNPGQHRIRATAKDGRTLEVAVELAEMQKEVVVLDWSSAAPLPVPVHMDSSALVQTLPSTVSPPQGKVSPQDRTKPPPSHAQRALAWTALGVGAAGITLGVTSGIITWVKYSRLRDDRCSSEMECPSSVAQDRIDGFNTWRKIPTPSFVIGGLAAAAGVTLIWMETRERPPNSVAVSLGPGAVSAVGTF